MKKVIFISALAIAAAVSCTKSDIVDTKFNEQVGFETYLGRDAQTKAEVIEKADLEDFGVYGYYTKNVEYDGTIAANLMVDQEVTKGEDAKWSYSPVKYWTNENDWYGFLAYAPYSLTTVEKTSEGATYPVVRYEVPQALGSQTDVLYANNKKSMKKNTVSLVFNHALSRVAINAKAVMYDATTGQAATSTTTQFDNFFTIKSVSFTGPFNVTGDLNLYSGEWEDEAPATTNPVYNMYTGSLELDDEFHSLSTKTEENKLTVDENYLMMIPTNFGTNKAALTIVYTITTNDVESSDLTKTVEISNDFAAGYAYAINLVLQLDPSNEITFDVEKVEGWKDADDTDKDVYGTDANTQA